MLKWKEGRNPETLLWKQCTYLESKEHPACAALQWTEVGLLRSLLLLMAKGPLREKCNQPWITHWCTEVGIRVRWWKKRQRYETEKGELTPKHLALVALQDDSSGLFKFAFSVSCYWLQMALNQTIHQHSQLFLLKTLISIAAAHKEMLLSNHQGRQKRETAEEDSGKRTDRWRETADAKTIRELTGWTDFSQKGEKQ